MQTSCNAVSPLFSKIIKTSYRPLPPIGITDLPAEKFLRWCLTLSTGTSSTSLVQTGPNLSALNSQRAGPATASFPGLGSGATNGYVIVKLLPGPRPIGSFVPIVMDNVCPSPSGLRISFSIEIP